MSFSKSFFCLALLFNLSVGAQISGPNLILHLSFDGNSLNDTSTYNHNVINHQTTFTSGINDSGVLFGGTNQYIEVSHSSNLEISNEVTMSMWYQHKTQNNSGAFYSLVEQSADEDGGHSRYGMWLFGNQLWICIEPDSCPGSTRLCQRCTSEAVTLTEDEWYHIVGTYNGQILKIYLNGQEIAEQDFGSSTGISVRSYPLTIGTDIYDFNPVYLKGTLDEIQLYDVALTQAQITQLYNAFNTASVNDINLRVKLFPNPATSNVNIQTNLRFKEVAIFNLQGQLLSVLPVVSETINVSSLNEGVYFLRFKDNIVSYNKRLVVSR